MAILQGHCAFLAGPTPAAMRILGGSAPLSSRAASPSVLHLLKLLLKNEDDRPAVGGITVEETRLMLTHTHLQTVACRPDII
jgi:hypothetical protein